MRALRRLANSASSGAPAPLPPAAARVAPPFSASERAGMGAATSTVLGFDAEGVLLDILEGVNGGDVGDPAAAQLVACAERGDWASVRALLSSGAAPSARLGGEQRTALHYAAAAGQPEVVVALLGAGADAGARCVGAAALTPLHAAADAQPTGCGGAACAQQRAALAAVVALLCAAGAPCNAADGEFLQVPLHLAARRGHAGAAAELLRAGALARVEDRFGDTPADLAEDAGWADLAATLRANET